MTAQRQISSQEERKVTDNLRFYWNLRKTEGEQGIGPEISQPKMAKFAGIAQSTVAQYLNYTIPVGPQALIQFAKYLRVNPRAISSAVARVIPVDTLQHRAVKVIKNKMEQFETERPPENKSQNELSIPASSQSVFAVLIEDNRFAPRIVKGDHVTYSIPARKRIGRLALGWTSDNTFVIGTLRNFSEERAVVQGPEGQDIILPVADVHMVESIFLNQELFI